MALEDSPAVARSPLSRERIAETAVRVMDDEGLEAVTMRRLGRELGVEAMSLYNHVEDKEDLFLAMIEAVLREFAFPGEDVRGWEDRVRLLARAYREVLRSHPDVMQLFAEHKRPPTSLDSLRPIDTALRTLREAGLDDDEVIDTYKMFSGYIMGFVMMETRGMFARDAEIDPVAAVAAMPAEIVPTLAGLFPAMCLADPDREFDFGIEMMIAGLRDKVRGRDVKRR
ncbi:MAG: TetR/AcrR family transcriptional regulator [Actinomycetota bacterium]